MASQFYRKMLVGMLPKIALEEIAATKIHGYALIILVRRKYHVYFGPSTIFPLLGNLAKDGLIACEWDLSNGRPRKVYWLTEKGKVALENFRLEMHEMSRAWLRTVGKNDFGLSTLLKNGCKNHLDNRWRSVHMPKMWHDLSRLRW